MATTVCTTSAPQPIESITTTTINQLSQPTKSAPSLAPIPDVELWTIHGKKYDLRSFASLHPGGHRALSLGQGTDCTEMFEMYHSFTNKHRLTLKAYIYEGPVSNPCVSPDKFDWDNTPFWTEVKAEVRKAFSPRGDETTKEIFANTKATWTAWLEHFVGFILVMLSFSRFLKGEYLAMFHFPFIYWICCSALMHNGSHFAMSTRPWVNTLSTYMGSLHVQYHLWAVQHVIGHHVYTNMLHLDPDIYHFVQAKPEQTNFPGYRLHQGQQYLRKYRRFWKFALVLQAAATTLAISLIGVPTFLSTRKVETTLIPERWVRKIKFDRAVLLFCVTCFVLHHGLKGLFMIFWSWVIHGALFNVFSQISHASELCMTAAEEYRVSHGLERNEWAVHQILSCFDYSCESKFFGMLSIQLNNQICHHLFPGVHPCHYPRLRRLIMPVAAKHGVDYAERSSGGFVDAVTRYINWLTKLNEKPSHAPQFPGMADSTKWLMIMGAIAMSVLAVLPLVCLYILR